MEDYDMKNIIKGIVIAGALLAAVSCQKFLNRPTEDNYSTASFYQTDEQVLQGINYLYNSPWYDFQRGFIKVGEVMSGNMYWGGSPYQSLTANGTDVDLKNMSYSLWSVNGHANTVIKNILETQGSTASQAVKDQVIGEALTLKALAYFFLVRTFGEVPIVHDNAELLAGEYNSIPKLKRECIYEYIIMTLEKAMELLPKNAYIGQYNRVDYYAAEALLAKTYLTKAGLGGSLNKDDLANAAKYAKDVIDNSGRKLSPRYSDIFRLDPKTFNATGEPLISWLWTVNGGQWTRQNTLQSDIMFEERSVFQMIHFIEVIVIETRVLWIGLCHLLDNRRRLGNSGKQHQSAVLELPEVIDDLAEITLLVLDDLMRSAIFCREFLHQLDVTQKTIIRFEGGLIDGFTFKISLHERNMDTALVNLNIFDITSTV